jgi:hypothetical protein
MNRVALRVTYVGALVTSCIIFMFLARPLVVLLPWGKVQFGVTFISAISVFFVGAILEHRLLWKGLLTSSTDAMPVRNEVPPVPISIGAAAGILGSLYV